MDGGVIIERQRNDSVRPRGRINGPGAVGAHMGEPSWPPPPVQPEPAELELLALAERMNLHAAQSMARVLPGCQYEEFDDFYVRSHPLPTETLNEARITKPPSDPQRTIDEALLYFQSRSPIWRLVCRPEWQPLLIDTCEPSGLAAGPGSPEMIMTSDLGRSALRGFDCRRVDDMRQLDAFQRTFSAANEVPDTGFWRSKALLDAAEWDLFLAYRQDDPVATGVGFTSDAITGVWAIATVPNHRGRGLGTAITWAVVNAGRRRGARAAHLWATEMGFPIYQKMGFRHLQNMAIWTHGPPESA